jgi:hypothetical protein
MCWNGRFYTHFVKQTPVTIAGVDESAQLSLSNPMDINRGVADHDQAVSILREYRRRRESTGAFAEWFAIDPPFPDGIFGDGRLVGGASYNGGIMPLVGGELARAAFEHGLEAYGVEILQQYHGLISAKGETFLWYFPDGTACGVETSPSREALPTDGWGSSAMLWALVEGLAGVVDNGRGFDALSLSPRWLTAGVREAEVSVGYAASGRGVGYVFRHAGDRISIEVDGAPAGLKFHVLLPAGARVRAVRHGTLDLPFREVAIESSAYADFEGRVEGYGDFTIALQ